MPLMNRVDPFGKIHAVEERGTFTGNRGVIHDPSTKTLLRRRWTTKAWIICLCEFRGRSRQVMGPGRSGNGSWTELFFLDEVTALAAGHRPCFYCRRKAATTYAECYGRALDIEPPPAPEIDRRLHAERIASGVVSGPLDFPALSAEPDGVMFSVEGLAFALRKGHLLPWSFAGYGKPEPLRYAKGRTISFITPHTSRMALSGGFDPVWHPTAET